MFGKVFRVLPRSRRECQRSRQVCRRKDGLEMRLAKVFFFFGNKFFILNHTD